MSDDSHYHGCWKQEGHAQCFQEFMMNMFEDFLEAHGKNPEEWIQCKYNFEDAVGEPVRRIAYEEREDNHS
jgi:hypothetical protein